ncbi:hypothetical protein V502_09595 [Pseudogymnoascus sp. VKM F-4520 (FW-2644)]|nr:hypothetical protein V502_09595 [Pseudogymnoascus sp. VKM F-4520 (FW-2644)]
MNSIAADFLSNLLASQTFRIWGKDSGVVTDEHVKVFVDERTSVMGDTTQEEDRAGSGGEEERGQGAGGVIQGQGGQEDILEDEGRGEASTRRPSGFRSPIGDGSPQDAVQPHSSFQSDPSPTRSGTAPPTRQSETPATGHGISDNPEPATPGRAQSSPTPSINPSDPQAESSIQADSAAPTGEASGQSPSAIPEDDGMRALRERVLRIQIKDITTDEKARLMHELLTEGYTKSQVGQSSTVPPSPATVVSQERPTTPTSISSFHFWPGKDNSPEKGDSVTFHLSQDDLKPTYAPLPPPVEGASDGIDEVEQAQAVPRTTIVTFAIFGKMIRTGVFITVMTAGFVESEWGSGRTSSIARAIEVQPMPEQFQDTKAMITCNDCRAKSAVPYHWLGLKCAVCDSYNTIQLNIINDEVIPAQPEDAAGHGDTAAEGATAEMAIPVPRSRRHSLRAGQTLAPRDYSSGLAPDVPPSRIGRSMSPVRGSYFTQPEPEATAPVAGNAEVWDDEDADFWGRTPGDLAADGDEEDEEEDEEDDDDLDLSLDDDDDDEDDIDTMELFGHR